MKRAAITHQFVDYIPDSLEEGVVYVCIPFATAVHKCCCGCGLEVVTPITPTDWQITYDGQSVSLDPSVGNWSCPCQSHYWVRKNNIIWARQWSKKEIELGRRRDMAAKYGQFNEPEAVPEQVESAEKIRNTVLDRFWNRLTDWVR